MYREWDVGGIRVDTGVLVRDNESVGSSIGEDVRKILGVTFICLFFATPCGLWGFSSPTRD